MFLDKLNLEYEDSETLLNIKLSAGFKEREATEFIIDFMSDQTPDSLLRQFHIELSYEERLKVTLLSIISTQFEVLRNKLIGMTFYNTIETCLEAPCVAALLSGDKGHIHAMEEIFQTYVTEEEFEQLHTESHKLNKIFNAITQDVEEGSDSLTHRTVNLN